MSTVTWHLLEICSGTGDDDVRVYAVELDVDDTAIEPRRTSLVAERDRGWARAHLCLDYLLSVGSVGSRDDPASLDGLGLWLFQGHLHTSSPSDTLNVEPVCVWVDERARRRYEPTSGNAHTPLLFEALGAMPFAASPQELVALARAARQHVPPSRRAHGLPRAQVQVPAIPRQSRRRRVAAALAQCALVVLLLGGGSPPAFPQSALGGPIPYIPASAGLVGATQPARSPAQTVPIRFAVIRMEEPEDPE